MVPDYFRRVKRYAFYCLFFQVKTGTGIVQSLEYQAEPVHLPDPFPQYQLWVQADIVEMEHPAPPAVL